MIQDQLQMSQLSFCLPTASLFDGDLLTAFNEDFESIQKETKTASSTELTSTLPCTEDKSIVYSNEKQENIVIHSCPKRKFFTKEEDNLLTMAAISFGMESWNSIAQYVPGKTPKQCRDRWTNYLQPSLNFKPWSNLEDQLLVSLVNTHGTHWSKMKDQFPSRSTNSIKNRWYWLIKNQVKVIPANKILNNKHQNYFDESTKNYNNFEKNILVGNKLNDNININMINNNTNLYGYSNNLEQNDGKPKYYYILKNISKPKKHSKSSKKYINLYENRGDNEQNTKLNQNCNELQTNSLQPNEVDDLISFSLEELEW